MKKTTIYEIKQNLKLENGSDSHFFDRKTLKFFGQTMKDFTVSTTEDPDLFRVHYTIRMIDNGSIVSTSFKKTFFRRYWERNVNGFPGFNDYVDRYVQIHNMIDC